MPLDEDLSSIAKLILSTMGCATVKQHLLNLLYIIMQIMYMYVYIYMCNMYMM